MSQVKLIWFTFWNILVYLHSRFSPLNAAGLAPQVAQQFNQLKLHYSILAQKIGELDQERTEHLQVCTIARLLCGFIHTKIRLWVQ